VQEAKIEYEPKNVSQMKMSNSKMDVTGGNQMFGEDGSSRLIADYPFLCQS
jgi:hypothetical protein